MQQAPQPLHDMIGNSDDDIIHPILDFISNHVYLKTHKKFMFDTINIWRRMEFNRYDFAIIYNLVGYKLIELSVYKDVLYLAGVDRLLVIESLDDPLTWPISNLDGIYISLYNHDIITIIERFIDSIHICRLLNNAPRA